MEELKRSFRPEFLNRIDEVIVFHSLSREDVKAIVDLMIRRVEAEVQGPGHRSDRAGQGPAGREGIRPGPGGPAADLVLQAGVQTPR